jgi:LysM repeat protein
VVLCAFAPAAAANVGHTVGPGETLWSIAAASNLTTHALAASNGLSENAQVVLGSTIRIPSEAEAASALTGAAPPTLGGYVVRSGDTLSAIAARSGVSVGQMAYMNGLDPGGVLLAGTHVKLPTGAPDSVPRPAAPVQRTAIAQSAPRPSPERVSSAQISQIAASHGVPGSLASAIAWQESGFNNSMVSGANARGVMQVLPGTFDWVQRNLTRTPLDRSSALGNVHAGSLYLGQLLRDAGGDPARAVGAYYQGLGSLRSRGMLPETRRYVANVLALRGRFGGP